MNLEQWLETATCGLSPLQRERIALEIGSHLQDAQEHLMRTLELGNDDGNITAQQTVGSLWASNNAGGIEVREAQGLLELKTDDGDIVVRKAAGQLQISSNTGEVRLKEVQLNPGAANRLKTDDGSIWITALNTPTGLLLQGRKDSGKLQVDLPGANTQIADSRFEVKLPRTNPVQVELTTNAGAIQIK